MAAWHRRYNLSGVVNCADRLSDWVMVVSSVLGTDEVTVLGHMTGAYSLYALSPVADIASCGIGRHDVWCLVHGDGANVDRFRYSLEAALRLANMPHSFTAHSAVLVLD